MRRLELLTTEVRESTDTKDLNSLGTYEIMRYFNDAQKQVQKVIFTSNPSADIFVRGVEYAIAGTQAKENDLPLDIYAHSSIISLTTKSSGQKITRVANTERPAIYGYSIVDKQFILSFNPQEDLILNYVYQLPLLSYRIGKIATVDTNTGVITVEGPSIIGDTGFTERYDNYSIVGSTGTSTGTYLGLTTFAGLSFTFTGDLSLVQVGDYIVCGENGSTHSKLPKECEPFIMMYVQRRILAKISSSEFITENAFTESERADLEDLFKDTVKDALYPVSSDTDYLGL